jgi:hypothetical protein
MWGIAIQDDANVVNYAVQATLAHTCENFNSYHKYFTKLSPSCDVAEHLCGEPCHLSGKGGCMSNCIKVSL